jgi:hypothetical protein
MTLIVSLAAIVLTPFVMVGSNSYSDVSMRSSFE